MSSHVSMPAVNFEAVRKAAANAANIAYAPAAMEQQDRDVLVTRIKQLLKQQDAVLVAHYYVSAELQQLASDAERVKSLAGWDWIRESVAALSS